MEKNCLDSIAALFKTYTASFYCGDDYADKNTTLKIVHTRNVRANINGIAASLNLTDSDSAIAGAIALLHDIGRFEQFRQYRTFDDRKSVNHAGLGLRIITRLGILNNTGPSEKRIIRKAVAHHNAFKLPDTLTKRERLFCSMIRDADKLDIFDILNEYYKDHKNNPNPVIDFELPESDDYSGFYIDGILAGRSCDYSFVKNATDVRLMRLSWIFDLNFAYSLNRAAGSGYIKNIAALLPRTNEIDSVIKRTEEYLKDIRTAL